MQVNNFHSFLNFFRLFQIVPLENLTQFSYSGTRILTVKNTILLRTPLNLLIYFFSNGLLQIVTKPTRCTPNSATIIDHIITNHVSGIFETIIFISQLSDHFPVLSFISLSKTVSKPVNVQSRDFSELNISNFKNSLSTLGWVNVTEQQDPQLAFNNFSDTFSTLYNLHMPLKTKKFNRNFSNIEPWMTTGLLISRRKKLF